MSNYRSKNSNARRIPGIALPEKFLNLSIAHSQDIAASQSFPHLPQPGNLKDFLASAWLCVLNLKKLCCVLAVGYLMFALF